jgi:zinc/manganese transport system permease protein
MTGYAEHWSIVWPALVAGLLVSATHVPLGIQVLRRGIVFIDLAIAQIAGLGVVAANFAGFETRGVAAQAFALSAALVGALVLAWCEARWAATQEALIGVVFVLAASAAILLLAANPHGGEHLTNLLAGQILWIRPQELLWAALATALVATLWRLRGERERLVFYLAFAIAVTLSVQLIGLYLVFATLIVPALATRRFRRYRLTAYGVAMSGYALGLLVSTALDLPAGPTIVWVMALVALFAAVLGPRRAPA